MVAGAPVPVQIGIGCMAMALGALAVAVIYAPFYYAKRRRFLQQLALASGFSFDEKAESLPQELLSSLPVFNTGHSQEAFNLLSCDCGGSRLLVFDYTYVTGHGKHKTGHEQTIVVVQGSRLLARFSLSPEGLGDKFLQLFGYQDIDFPENPEFSRMYLVRGEDELAVRQLFSMEAMMQLQSSPGWTLEGGGQWLALYKTGKLQYMENVEDYIAQARVIASAFG